MPNLNKVNVNNVTLEAAKNLFKKSMPRCILPSDTQNVVLEKPVLRRESKIDTGAFAWSILARDKNLWIRRVRHRETQPRLVEPLAHKT
jgi:hypothetical protein